MGIIAWVIMGGLAGWIGSMVMGTNASQGFIVNILVGILGACIGGFAFSYFGCSGVTGFNFYSLFVATIGSVVVIWLTKVIRS